MGNHEYDCDQVGADELRKLLGFAPYSETVPPPSSISARSLLTAGEQHGVCVLLEDQSVVVEGLRFYGTPWNGSSGQSWGCRREERQKHFDRIPTDTDVLISHMPPYKVLDSAWSTRGQCYTPWGCRALGEIVERQGVPLHCFGHVHDEVGIVTNGITVFSNGAMDLYRRPNVLTLRTSVARNSGEALPTAGPATR